MCLLHELRHQILATWSCVLIPRLCPEVSCWRGSLAAAYSALQPVLTLVARQQCDLEDRIVLLRILIPPL